MTTQVLLIASIGLVVLLLLRARSGSSSDSYTSIDGSTAHTILGEGRAVALDVRTPSEVSQGSIDKATFANVTSLDFNKKLSKLDKTKAYVVYCRSGNRSRRACQMMHKRGFTALYNLEGGYAAYLDAGKKPR